MLVKSKHTKLDTDYIIFFKMGATMASCEVLWMLSVALEKKTSHHDNYVYFKETFRC